MRKKRDRCILCIEPLAELPGKCVVRGCLGFMANVYLRLTTRTKICYNAVSLVCKPKINR